MPLCRTLHVEQPLAFLQGLLPFKFTSIPQTEFWYFCTATLSLKQRVKNTSMMCQSTTQMSAFLIYFCYRGSRIWALYNTCKGRSSGQDYHVLSSDSNLCADWCICRGKYGWSETFFLTWLGPLFCVPGSSNLFCGAGWNVMVQLWWNYYYRTILPSCQLCCSW